MTRKQPGENSATVLNLVLNIPGTERHWKSRCVDENLEETHCKLLAPAGFPPILQKKLGQRGVVKLLMADVCGALVLRKRKQNGVTGAFPPFVGFERQMRQFLKGNQLPL